MRHRLLAAVLGIAGVAHFVSAKPFEDIVPHVLGHERFWVQVSGVAELLCAAGLLHPRTRRWAATATAALFVLVFPANVQMALDGGGEGVPAWAAWARLPLQVPLVLWALAIRRSAS